MLSFLRPGFSDAGHTMCSATAVHHQQVATSLMLIPHCSTSTISSCTLQVVKVWESYLSSVLPVQSKGGHSHICCSHGLGHWFFDRHFCCLTVLQSLLTVDCAAFHSLTI